MEYAKKLGKFKSQKLSKSRKLKSEKMFKSQNLTKLEKKLSKSWNSSNFRIIKVRLKFLIPDAKTFFNCLWLAYIKALIL